MTWTERACIAAAAVTFALVTTWATVALSNLVRQRQGTCCEGLRTCIELLQERRP